ncbi:hypothetical protein GH714_020720 [Hevea brasiliensis]|uniref:Uncharacterized protein n=1 Tax=Hevea brasiliensis TaxID=3981 RepID=A0A6A6L1R1_HEVBR|nr:hypothetical protein GH714_020720 [Hevea brasiliensis]
MQLKEILAKQAELGVEVAEIPSHYLSDSEKQVNEREDNRMFVTKKGRFLNKRDRRGRYNRNDRLAKQQTLANKDSSNMSSFNERKPTLLQKLLSADIRKDKHHLLQVFRLMVANSFFDDWPEKPLKFPLVVVKEYGREDDEQVAENSSITGKAVATRMPIVTIDETRANLATFGANPSATRLNLTVTGQNFSQDIRANLATFGANPSATRLNITVTGQNFSQDIRTLVRANNQNQGQGFTPTQVLQRIREMKAQIAFLKGLVPRSSAPPQAPTGDLP